MNRAKASALLLLSTALCALLHAGVAADAPKEPPKPKTQPIEDFVWTKVEGIADAQRVFPSALDLSTVYVSSAGGLAVSTDNGLTFKALPAESLKALGTITALLESPVRKGRLYAGTDAKGVFISEDGGASWKALGGVDKGLAHLHIHKLIFDSDDPTFTTLYALHSMDHPGVSVSSDGGATWRAFAKEFGAHDLTDLDATFFLAGSHPAGQGADGLYQGADFYRSIDAGKNWFRLLNVEARPADIVGSRVSKREVWFATAGGRLMVTYDFGTSSSEVGPEKGMNTVSLAQGLGPTGEELFFAYDPTGLGVIYSSDKFDTWQALNTGLYVGDLVAEGAMMAANPDGSVLYIVKNGELDRGARKSRAIDAVLRSEPCAVFAGEGGVTFTCKTAAGADVKMDLTSIGGPNDFALKDDGQSGDGAAGDGVFGGTFAVPAKALTPNPAYKGPRLPGLAALPVKIQKGGASDARLAVVYVLARTPDSVLWNGEAAGGAASWTNGAVQAAPSTERPLSGSTHLRVAAADAGQAGFSWRNNPIDSRPFKYLSFFIRSNKSGPTTMRLELRDDGKGYGLQHAGHSNLLDLAPYLKTELGNGYQYVTIPLSHFVLGGAAVPQRIREIVFDSPGGEDRAYDFDEFAFVASRGARLGPANATVKPDGSGLRLQLRAINASTSARTRASIGDMPVDLFDDGKHGDDGAGDGLFAADVPLAQAGGGLKAVRFALEDGDVTAQADVPAFVPRRAPGSIPVAPAGLKLTGDLKAFDAIPPFTFSKDGLELRAYLVKGPTQLYVGLAVKDAAFTPPDEKKKKPSPEQLLQGAGVELLITSPCTAALEPRSAAGPFDHRLTFALGEKSAYVVRAKQVHPTPGQKTADGYVIEAQLPLDWFHGPNNRRCDFELGRATRIEWRLRGTGGKFAAWASPDAASVENPDQWGLAHFTNEAGAPRIEFVSCSEKSATFSSNKPLDPASAKPSAFDIPGVKITGAQVSSNGRTLYLSADAWPLGGDLVLKTPGLKAADGAVASGELKFIATAGRPYKGELFQEFLLGEPRQGINPETVFNEDPPGLVESKPAEGNGWRVVRSENGVYDLCGLLGEMNSCAVSAHAYVYSDRDQAVQVWTGSDDGIKVHLNGQAVLTNVAQRGCAPDSDKIQNVRLGKGWNRLLLTISQGGGGWAFCARIVDENGKPPQGVNYSAASPFGPQSKAEVAAPPPPQKKVDAACTAGVTVEKIDFRGWKDAWKISNESCEVIVVPAVARIISFSLKGKESVLWIEPGNAGKTAKDDKQWHNFGGDKIWPAQQDQWGWPPPYHFDCAPNTADAIPGGVRLTTPVSPVFGAQGMREIVLDEKKPLLRIHQEMTRTGDQAKELTLWSVTQVRKPEYAMLPLGQEVENKSGGKERYKPLGALNHALFRAHKTVLSISNDDEPGQKVGVKPDEAFRDGWVAAVFPGLMLVESHALVQDAKYPDGGMHGEIYTAPKAVQHYVEIELLGPMTAPKKGEKFKHDLVWQLVTLDGQQQDDPERAAAAARKAHQDALPLLKP